MSDADNAWQEWDEAPNYTSADALVVRAAFLAGYKRALEDAADEWDTATGGYDDATAFLRDRASSVGTKDGASDHE